MGDHERISYLPVPGRDDVPEGVSRLWDKAQEAFGFVPNVFRAQAVNGEQFLAWWGYFNLLVNKEGTCRVPTASCWPSSSAASTGARTAR